MYVAVILFSFMTLFKNYFILLLVLSELLNWAGQNCMANVELPRLLVFRQEHPSSGSLVISLWLVQLALGYCMSEDLYT